MLSVIVFQTEESREETEKDKTDCYLVYLCTSVPFGDNIEGH